MTEKRYPPRWMMDMFGYPNVSLAEIQAAQSMMKPVKCCHCGRVYDIGEVTIVARYVDCTMWNTPCCHVTADDRGETGWSSFKHYEVLKL